jgi:hypothetical protein
MKAARSCDVCLRDDCHRLGHDYGAECYRIGYERLRDTLATIANASYTELRPHVERYALDPQAASSLYPPGKGVYRSFATEREWEVARSVAGRLQAIAGSALRGLA